MFNGTPSKYKLYIVSMSKVNNGNLTERFEKVTKI